MSVFVIYLIYYIYKGLGTYESETYQIRLAAAIHLRHLLGCCRNLCPYTGTRWLDNFSIISFRMLLAALITGIWILFYNRHLFYVHRRDFWLFIGIGMIGMTALSVFYNISVTKDLLHFLPCYLPCLRSLFCFWLLYSSMNDNQTQTDLCNTRTHWLCTGKRSTGKQWTFLEHNRNSLRNSGKLFSMLYIGIISKKVHNKKDIIS